MPGLFSQRLICLKKDLGFVTIVSTNSTNNLQQVVNVEKT